MMFTLHHNDHLLEDWQVALPAEWDDDTTVAIPVGILRLICDGVEAGYANMSEDDVHLARWARRTLANIREGVS